MAEKTSITLVSCVSELPSQGLLVELESVYLKRETPT